MPLIKPVNSETISLKAKFSKNLHTEMEQYIQWASVMDKEYFLVEAAKYLLKMDKDWKNHKMNQGIVR